LAIYAVERSDDATAATVAFAIATAGVTYVIAASAYLAGQCGSAHCRAGFPPWISMMAPTVAITFVGFLVLNVAGTRMRSVHLQRIDRQQRAEVPPSLEATDSYIRDVIHVSSLFSPETHSSPRAGRVRELMITVDQPGQRRSGSKGRTRLPRQVD
jgi:hypothetical protein